MSSSEERNLEDAAEGEHPIAQLDLAILQAAETWQDHPVVELIGKVSELADQPPLIAASGTVAMVGYLQNDDRLMRTGLRMLAGHAIATGIKTLLKNRIDRPRPDKVREDGEHDLKAGSSDDGEERSFPSGHTAGAVAVARAIAREYPQSAASVYGAAAVVSLIQIPRGAHHPSDVATGAVIGLVGEILSDRLFRALGYDFRSKDQLHR